ncbi:MAG TPA: hypothetical protein VEW48_22460 [Thermoanaerobaculia bacterium]|nr:hypothetical protein [Thermoanaerobaculia bacterium]
MESFPLCLLPGLWVTLLAVLLWAALGRWLDPVPRRVRLVHAAVLLVLFGPVLFAGRVLLPLGYLLKIPPLQTLWSEEQGLPPGNLLQSDLVLQITPWQIRVREALHAGEWPLWNHLAGAGEPLLGNPQAQVLQPLVWPALFFPAAAGAGITAALRVLIALTFMYLLLRRQGISEAPALAGSLAFGLGGGVLLWLGWPMANAPALLPVMLYALSAPHPLAPSPTPSRPPGEGETSQISAFSPLARSGGGDGRGGQGVRGLLTFAVFALLNAGHPETILHVSLLAALFALSRLAASPREERLRLVRAWSVAAGLGLGLSAPALLPAAHALPESLRAGLLADRREHILHDDPLAGWRTSQERSERLRQLGERLLPIVAPRAFGDSRYGEWWGESNTNEDGAAFAGTAAVLGALLSLLAGRRRLPQERAILGFTIAALIVLAQPPGLPQLLSSLPVLRDSLTLHHRLVLTLGFCVAFLGACSWERWRRGEIPRTRAAVALAGTAMLLGLAYFNWPPPSTLTRLPGAEAATLLDVRQLSQVLQFGVLAAAGWLLLGRPRPDRAVPAGLALAGLAAIELLAHHLPSNPPVPARLFYPETPAITFLRERTDPWHRISGVGSPLRPNIATVYGLADPRTSNPAKPAPVADALVRINRFPYRATDGFVAPRDPLYELLGVQYIMAPSGQRIPGLQLVWKDQSVWIYQVSRPLPRLFLSNSTLACPPGNSWSACTAQIGNFRRRTAVLPAAASPPGSNEPAWRAAAPRGYRFDLLEIHPAWIRARLEAAEPRLLASSLYQDGGWVLLVNGIPRPTFHANGPFLAAWLQPADRDLELIYRPKGFVLGMVLAAIALAVGATYSVARWGR